MNIDEKIIKLVKERKILYDKSHKDYKKIGKKGKAWTEIGKELNMTNNAVKKRWTTLKDRYHQLKKKVNKPSGSKGGSKLKHYKFDDLLKESSSENKSTTSSYDELASEVSMSYDKIIKESRKDELLAEKSETEVINRPTPSSKSPILHLNRSSSPAKSSGCIKKPKLVDDLLIKKTNEELLVLMRSLKDDSGHVTKEAAFCDCFRIQLEDAKLSPQRFMDFQVKVFKLLSES